MTVTIKSILCLIVAKVEYLMCSPTVSLHACLQLSVPLLHEQVTDVSLTRNAVSVDTKGACRSVNLIKTPNTYDIPCQRISRLLRQHTQDAPAQDKRIHPSLGFHHL